MRVYIYCIKQELFRKDISIKCITSKIPSHIRVLNDRSIHEILDWRTERLEKINQRREENGKERIKMTMGWLIVGWGLETDLIKHEIIERYL